MLIETPYDGIEIHREEKIIFAKFLIPHQVISTCRVAGGLKDDMAYIYNHQSCEPAGHHHKMTSIAVADPSEYHKMISRRYGLPPEACAALGTAANMNNVCIKTYSFRNLSVTAVCTGGVEANAGRATDPASVIETENGFEKLEPQTPAPGPGTINTMIFINLPLIPGAMVRSIMTATEAKSAVLQELAVNSRYSDKLATGTGTDQIAVAAAVTENKPLTSAGKHAKLGELIGKSVYFAIKGALALQNSLTPSGQRSVKIHLERFGLTRQKMIEAVCSHLTKDDADLLRKNFMGIERDPITVAAVAAIAHLKDKFTWGILPESCWSEVMGAYAAQIACAVSGDYGRLADYRKILAPVKNNNH
ncbi:MAG: adenosylcobinamide amidohydrolase, partial [Desulfobacteraceae bacterium]